MRHFFACGVLCLAAATSLSAQEAPPGTVVGSARRLAAAAVARVEEQATTLGALPGLSAEEARAAGELRSHVAAALAVLEAVMEEADSSHFVRSASAFGVFVLDSTRADAAARALLGEADAMMFANIETAQSLLVAMGAPAVPELVQHLHHPAVVRVLAAMGNEARTAVPALVASLGSGNVDAASALVSIGTPGAVAAAQPVLVAALDAEDWHDSRTALEALARIGSAARPATPRIQRLLEHPSADVRLSAALALADLGAVGRAVPALTELVANPGLDRRFVAIQKLAELGSRARGATGELLEVVQDAEHSSIGERADAAVALARIAPGSQQYRAAVREVIADAKLQSLVEARGVRVRQ